MISKSDIRSTAQAMYADPSDDDIEVDDDAPIHPSDDGGYWVQAWVFVRLTDLEKDDEN